MTIIQAALKALAEDYNNGNQLPETNANQYTPFDYNGKHYDATLCYNEDEDDGTYQIYVYGTRPHQSDECFLVTDYESVHGFINSISEEDLLKGKKTMKMFMTMCEWATDKPVLTFDETQIASLGYDSDDQKIIDLLAVGQSHSGEEPFNGYWTVTRIHDKELDKSDLIDAVIEQMKEDIEKGDWTAIQDLLNSCPNSNLYGYLPEDESHQFEHLV